MNKRWQEIDPSIEPIRMEGGDGGAGRGQRRELLDPDAAMNAFIRAGARYGRERLAELQREELH